PGARSPSRPGAVLPSTRTSLLTIRWRCPTMSSLIRTLLIAAPIVVIGYGPNPALGQTWRTMTSARQVWDRDPIEVDIDYGAGTLQLGAAEAPMLYEMEIRFDEERFTPVAEWNEERRLLRLGARFTRSNRSNVREGSAATIKLTRDVP